MSARGVVIGGRRAAMTSIPDGSINLETGVLDEVGVGVEVSSRDWEEVVLLVYVLTGEYAALPLPVVASVATELVETDERRASIALEVELTAPLVTKDIEVGAWERWGISASAKLIDGREAIGRGDTAIEAGSCLGVDKVSLSLAHERPVGVNEL